MKLPNSAHTGQPWDIHELAQGFELEDVWALPTPGGPDDFPRLVEVVKEWDPARSSSRAVRALFAIRYKLGALLRWEERSEASFTPFYEDDDEWAVEIDNRTVHGILHVGWVRTEAGAYRGQLAIYVKRHGLLGAAYMAAITPFRRLIVYPQLMRELEREWQLRSGAPR